MNIEINRMEVKIKQFQNAVNMLKEEIAELSAEADLLMVEMKELQRRRPGSRRRLFDSMSASPSASESRMKSTIESVIDSSITNPSHPVTRPRQIIQGAAFSSRRITAAHLNPKMCDIQLSKPSYPWMMRHMAASAFRV